jgi:hypothetical protein
MAHYPGVDVGLAADRKGEFPVGEPAEEPRRLNDLGADAPGSQRFPLGSGPEFGQQLPSNEPADQLGVFRPGDGGEMFDQPPLERTDLLVDNRQDPTRHQKFPQVGRGPPGLQGVKGLMGQLDLPAPETA